MTMGQAGQSWSNPLPAVDFGHPKRLAVLASKLEERAFQAPRDAFDFNALVAKLEASEPDRWQLTNRERRRLTWALGTGTPPLFTRTCLEQVLQATGESGGVRGTTLRGAVYAYFSLEPGASQMNAGLLRAWVRARLEEYSGTSPVLVHFKRHAGLFTINRASLYSAWLQTHPSTSLRASIQSLKVPAGSHVLRDILASYAGRIATDKAHRDALLHLLETGIADDASSRTPFPRGVLKNCLDPVLQALDQKDDVVLNFCLQHFGDPRIDRFSIWATMSKRARDLVSMWVSEEDLRRFFGEISGDPRRRDFWRRYLDEGRVTYSRLALGDQDESRAGRELQRQVVLGRYARLRDSEASAFFLSIEGKCIIVEFSQKGHATGLYSASSLPRDFLLRRSYSIAELKQLRRERFIHRDSRDEGWESKFARMLYEMYGILPPRGRWR